MTPSTTRRLLREAVALLGAAPIRDGYQAWRDMRAAFLTDLAAALGVSGTETVIEALSPKKRYRDRKTERAARNLLIVEAYEQPGATLAGVATQFEMGVSAIHSIYHKTAKRAERGIDPDPALMPVSPLSRTDRPNPDAGQNDECATADQIAQRRTTSEADFQPCAT